MTLSVTTLLYPPAPPSLYSLPVSLCSLLPGLSFSLWPNLARHSTSIIIIIINCEDSLLAEKTDYKEAYLCKDFIPFWLITVMYQVAWARHSWPWNTSTWNTWLRGKPRKAVCNPLSAIINLEGMRQEPERKIVNEPLLFIK